MPKGKGYGFGKAIYLKWEMLDNHRVALMLKWFKKGSKMMIEGKLKHNSFEGDDKIKRYYTEVQMTGFEFLGKSDNNSTTQTQAQTTQQTPESNTNNQNGENDDLPF